MAKEIVRRILFYRAHNGVEEDGSPTPVDWEQVVTLIHKKPFTLPGRYLEDSGGPLCAWIPSANAKLHKDRMVLGRVRRIGLPQVDDGAGRLAPITIAQDSGLAELTHVVFFPHNVVGFDFNVHAPRSARLAFYLRTVCEQLCPALELYPLIRPDIAAQLDSVSAIKVMTIEVRRNWVDTLEEASPSLAAAARATYNTGAPESIGIILRPEKHSRHRSLAAGIMDEIKAILGLDTGHGMSTFKVQAYTDSELERTVDIDLLRPHIVASKKMILIDETSRDVDSASAFSAIREAYNELSDEIGRAPSFGMGAS